MTKEDIPDFDEEEIKQQELEQLYFNDKESDSGSKSSKRDNNATHGIKGYVLGSLIQSVVEKNDFNTNNLHRH